MRHKRLGPLAWFLLVVAFVCFFARSLYPKSWLTTMAGPRGAGSAWRRAWLGSCTRKQLVPVWKCPYGNAGATHWCVCDPPREDGGGCQETDADGCNAGGMGRYWRYVRDLPSHEQWPRVCFNTLPGFVEYDKLPSARTRDDCDVKLPQGLCLTSTYCVPPHAIMQGCSIGSFALAIAIVLYLKLFERNCHRQLKRATVRIGVYSRSRGCMVGWGSGAIVSPQGHILTAAHVLIGQSRAEREARTENWLHGDDTIICIGVYEGANKPSRWVARAKVLTEYATLREKSADDGTLLDLAVLLVVGELDMDPDVFTREHALHTTFAVVTDAYSADEGLRRILDKAEPVRLDLSGEPVEAGERLAVFGWPSAEPDMRELHVSGGATCLVCSDHKIRSQGWVHAGSSGGPVVNAASELVGVVSHDEHHGHNLHDDDKPYRSFHRCITLLNPNHGLPARYCPPLADKHPAVPMIELNLSSKPVDCDAIGLVVDQAASTYRIVPRGDGSPSGRRTASPPRPTRTPSEDALGPPSLKRQDTDASFGALSPIKPLGTRVDPEAPADAKYIAFAYPHQITDEEAAALSEIELANTGESVIALIAGGAFLYFDGDKKLCGAGVMWRPNRDLPRLSFDVPVRLSSQGRLDVKQLSPKEVTFVILKEMGVKQFVFVPPGTKLGGTTYACGGFAYLYDPNGGTKEFPHARYDCVWPLKPPSANASRQRSGMALVPARDVTIRPHRSRSERSVTSLFGTSPRSESLPRSPLAGVE